MSNRLPKDRYVFVPVEDMPSNVQLGVLKEWLDRDAVNGVTVNTVCAPLKGLIRQYATSYPNWTFECLYTYYHPSPIDEVKVFVGDEYIGMIGYNVRMSKFQVSSPRIERDMDRKRMRETANLAIAHKLICSFSTKSVADNFLEAQNELRDGVRRLSRSAGTNHRSLTETLSPIFQEYALRNWESVMDWAAKNVDARMMGTMHNLHSVVHERDVSYSLHLAATTPGDGVCVYVQGDVYAVEKGKDDAGAERHVVYSNSDRLPPEVRRAIGLLKLVDDNSALDGVGYKCDNNKFLLMASYLAANRG